MKPNPYNIVTPNLVVVGPPLLDDHFAGQEFPQGKPMPTKTPRERFEDLVKKLYPEICMIKNGFLEHEWKYKEPDSLWSFIETLLEEARQEEREKIKKLNRYGMLWSECEAILDNDYGEYIKYEDITSSL